MRKTFRIAIALGLLGGAGAAETVETYELIKVMSGDTILVEENGEEVRIELSGVWVPAPGSPTVQAEYRGAEAQQFVKDLLLVLPAYVKEVESSRDEGPVEVRIRLGEQGEYDLAVLLADAGLALLERSHAADPDHLDAIYEAERNARRAERGMHDGGYREFEQRSGGQELDFGIGTLSVSPGSSRSGRILAYLEERTDSGGSGRRQSGIHKNPVKAIRDWGSRMGLPRDASSAGI